MAMKRAPDVPELRLTQHALRRHAKATADGPQSPRTRRQHANPEMNNSLPSTDSEGAVQIEEIDQILMDPVQKRDLLAAFARDPELFGIANTVKTPVRESIDLIDTRPTYAQPFFLPAQAPHQNTSSARLEIGTGEPDAEITPTIEATVEESPRQSINSDHGLARLIKTTPAQEDQLRTTLPSHFPQFQHIQNHGELGFYIDRSQYAISVGSGPVDDLHYGIIIVPLGEEHMLFRSEHESRKVPLKTQQESSPLSIDEIRPRIINSVSLVAARESLTEPATLSKPHIPLKQTRNSRMKSSRISKATRTRSPRTPAHIRRSQRLKAGRRTT